MQTAAELKREIARLERKIDDWNLFGANGDAIRALEEILAEHKEELNILEHPEDYETVVSVRRAA